MILEYRQDGVISVMNSMKSFLVYLIFFGCLVLGVLYLYWGVKKLEDKELNFSWKHLFEDRSLAQSSGKQLIVEGVLLILGGVLVFIFSIMRHNFFM